MMRGPRVEGTYLPGARVVSLRFYFRRMTFSLRARPARVTRMKYSPAGT